MITDNKLPATRQEFFTEAYEHTFPKVAAFVKKMGGSLEEAKDIFQDALIIYYEKNAGGIHEADHASPYIMGITRYLWYKTYRTKKLNTSLTYLKDLEAPEDALKISGSIFYIIERSGKKCLDLLRAFYYDKLNMKELADKFGFSGERSATTQKFKCLEKVRETIKKHSLSKEDFYE